MLRLEYINELTTNKWEHIGDFETPKEIFTNIRKFLKKCKYKSYYTRSWVTEDGYTMIDVGSHTQFHRYKEIPEYKGCDPRD